MSERWIAIDWGTSNLRAWLMDGTTAEAQAASGDGMGSLTPDAFEPALLKLAKPWLAEHGRLDAVACGMVGARQGWREAPYVSVPSPPLDPARFVHAPCSDARLTVTIVHGMSQDDPAEIMRGEETQLAGLLALDPGFDGMACLPGTHSKWARLAGGRMRGFATFMTGELFSLLDRQSVLRHVTGDGRDDTAFAGGVTDGLADPASLVSSLFGIRAAALVAGLKPASARERLSGLLIGAEIAAARTRFGAGVVTVIGTDALADRYVRALEIAGVGATSRDGSQLVLAGLTAARRAMKENAG